MKNRFIVLGKAASGKDFLQKCLIDEGYIPLRQYTTRPRRPNEVGDEYHFVNEREFDYISDSLKSVQNFIGWWYGYDINEALQSDVMIFSPANFLDLTQSSDSKSKRLLQSSTIVYLDIDEETRRERLSVRYIGGTEDDSLERRLQADKQDFVYFDSIDWSENPYGYVRLCSKEDVDDFLKKLLS